MAHVVPEGLRTEGVFGLTVAQFEQAKAALAIGAQVELLGPSNAALHVYPDAGHGSLFKYHVSFVRHATTFLESESPTEGW